MGWRSSWEGLWRRKPGIYFSRICTRDEFEKIPKNFRLIIKENKNHINNNSKTPRFVFSFSDAEEQKGILMKTEEPVIKDQVVKICNEFSKMADVAVNYKEKEYAKRVMVKKLLLLAQKISGVNLAEVISSIDKNKLYNFKK